MNESQAASGSSDGALLDRSLASERIASGYLISGPAERAEPLAERFARGIVCTAAPSEGGAPCGECEACRRSAGSSTDEAVEIDASGKRGPLYRHIGDHADLFWVDRGHDSTRVRIGQIRALQNALRLGSHEGGRRCAVIAGAEWMNVESQNALLRVLEEPPERTTIVLVSASAASLLATIRSRCQRVALQPDAPAPLRSDDAGPEERALALRFDGLPSSRLGELLDWAEEYRGERSKAAEGVHVLLSTGSRWLRERVGEQVQRELDPRASLRAFRSLATCRKDLDQRNANPQMVAERALLALREASVR